jgi:hypothetical protein
MLSKHDTRGRVGLQVTMRIATVSGEDTEVELC